MTDLAVSLTPPPGPGWVQLPVEPPKRKLFGGGRGTDKALTEWATAKARETLGPEAAADAITAFADTLTRLAVSGRERGENMAFAWFPGTEAVPVAQLSVSEFGRSGERPTMDQLEEKFGWQDGQTGPLEVTRMDLPGGPAVRVRREQAVGDGPSDVVVSVTYAFLPPQTKQSAIILTMFWVLSDDEPMFTEIADSTAKTLRVIA